MVVMVPDSVCMAVSESAVEFVEESRYAFIALTLLIHSEQARPAKPIGIVRRLQERIRWQI